MEIDHKILDILITFKLKFISMPQDIKCSNWILTPKSSPQIQKKIKQLKNFQYFHFAENSLLVIHLWIHNTL